MKNAKSGSNQKRMGCKEVSREFSFLCVLFAQTPNVLTNSKSSLKRSAQ